MGGVYTTFLRKWAKILREASDVTKRQKDGNPEALGSDVTFDKALMSSFDFLTFDIEVTAQLNMRWSM